MTIKFVTFGPVGATEAGLLMGEEVLSLAALARAIGERQGRARAHVLRVGLGDPLGLDEAALEAVAALASNDGLVQLALAARARAHGSARSVAHGNAD